MAPANGVVGVAWDIVCLSTIPVSERGREHLYNHLNAGHVHNRLTGLRIMVEFDSLRASRILRFNWWKQEVGSQLMSINHFMRERRGAYQSSVVSDACPSRWCPVGGSRETKRSTTVWDGVLACCRRVREVELLGVCASSVRSIPRGDPHHKPRTAGLL